MAVLNPEQFARRCQQLAKVPEAVGAEAVRRNAINGKAIEDAEIRSATKGTGKISNAGKLIRGVNGDSPRVVGRAGAAVSATIQVRSKGEYPGTYVKAVGPLHLINNDTKAHEITAAGVNKSVLAGPTLNGKRLRSASGRSTKKGRAGRSVALRTPYGLKARVHVKGTRGKNIWQHGFEKTAAEAPAILAAVSQAELAKIIR